MVDKNKVLEKRIEDLDDRLLILEENKREKKQIFQMIKGAFLFMLGMIILVFAVHGLILYSLCEKELFEQGVRFVCN